MHCASCTATTEFPKCAQPPCAHAQWGGTLVTPMDWNDLRYLLALARQKTLAGAARELGVEHSTVSRRIAALEATLGAKVFSRTPEGFVLTEAGQQVLPLAEQAEVALQAIERRAKEDGKIAGTVKLATSEILARFLIDRLRALRARHPGLVIEVLVGNQPVDLARREADLAVRAMRTDNPDLLVRKLVEAGWSVYAAKGYVELRGRPVDEDLTGHDLIAFEDSMKNTPGGLWAAEHAAGANVVMRAGNVSTAFNAGLAALGVVALPCFVADVEPTLERLTPRVIGVRVMELVVHPDAAKVAKVRAVMDFVIELFVDERRLLRGE